LRAFRSRCLWFSGDSVNRELHFALLSFAYGCHNVSASTSRADTARFSRRPPHEQRDHACGVFRQEMRNNTARETRVPVNGNRANDIVVLWRWAPFVRNQTGATELLPAVNASACDLFVINSGLWELRWGREAGMSGAVQQLVAALTATPRLAHHARMRVLWRMTLPLERPRGRADTPGIRRTNVDIRARLTGAQLPILDAWPAIQAQHAAAARHGVALTRDGMHPTPRVYLAIVRALVARLSGMPAMFRQAVGWRPLAASRFD